MAIAFDAASEGVAVATSLTFAHTAAGSNLLMFVGVEDQNDTLKATTGVTYNGVALTFIADMQSSSTGRWISLWYLIAPGTGANNIVVTLNTLSYVYGFGLTYTGAKQTGQPDNSTTNDHPSAGTMTTSLTTVADNCWTVLLARANGGVLAASTGSTLRGLEDTFETTGIFDSNGPITPAGSTSMAVTGGEPLYSIMASFAPFVTATNSPAILNTPIRGM